MKETIKVSKNSYKVTKDDVGCLVLVRFSDVGRIEGILVDWEVEQGNGVRVFFPTNQHTKVVEIDQITEVGKRIAIGFVASL